jgi:hypothetical protein
MNPSRSIHSSLILGTLFLCSCVAMGWRFGPGFPCTRGPWFAEPPVVEHRGKDYFLTWTQGEHPFFFQPDYKVIKGRLVFAMVATASSGNLAGRHREMKLEGSDNLSALQHGGAFWWESEPEPEGTFVRLAVIER